MEIILLVLIVAILVMLANMMTAAPDDNREPYVRDEGGGALALRVAGPVDDVPQHESFIHDGTAHQNPAVRDYRSIRWFLLFPFSEACQERYYPITDNGQVIDLTAIARRVDRARLRRGQVVELVPMPAWAEREAIRREHGAQLDRGVPSGKLRKRGL